MNRHIGHGRTRPAFVRNAVSAVTLCAVALISTSCSTGSTADQNQTAALVEVQTITNDANAFDRAQGVYAQDVQQPCPANMSLTGRTVVPTCGQPQDLSAAQLAHDKAAIATAKTKLAAAERKCLVLLGTLRDGRADQYILQKHNCQSPLG